MILVVHIFPMVTDKIKELADLKEKAAKLEAKVIVERRAELAALPAAYGYDNLKAFIKALKESAGKRRGRKPGKQGKPGRPAGKRKRAKVTPEIRDKVKAAVQAGEKGAAIAKKYSLSVQTVQNIKKAFGLVKSRSAASAAS
jgi:hypothetical protein